MKVMCEWVTCKHNDSRTAGVPGTCKADEISMGCVEYEDEYGVVHFEALDCKTFEWRHVIGQPPVIAD